MKQSGWCLTSRALPPDAFASGCCAFAQLGGCARRNSPALAGGAGAFAMARGGIHCTHIIRIQYVTSSLDVVQDVCSQQTKPKSLRAEVAQAQDLVRSMQQDLDQTKSRDVTWSTVA